MFNKLSKKSDDPKKTPWWRQWLPKGVCVTANPSEVGGIAIDDPLLGGYLTQLVDDGLAIEFGNRYFLDWDSIYVALSNPSYATLHEVLQFPVQTDAQPKLHSVGSLTDREFSIAIGWSSKSSDMIDVEVGPILNQGGRPFLMRQQQWVLFKEVVAFARRSDSERNDLFHEQAWGRIRKLALAADARLDDFLFRSIVLTPEKLQIGLRRSDAVADDRVIEIEPMFEDAPAGWLEAFDCSREVRNQYDIATPDGIVQVLIVPKIRTVLQEIKRLPGRRVAGSRAQAFLLNPYATLGDDASDVIEETQFEKAREDAGLDYERFTPVFERDVSGYPNRVGLLIETAVLAGPTSSETQWLDDVRLSAFIEALQKAIELNYQLVAWDGYDLVVDGDAARHLRDMQDALLRRQTSPMLVSYAQVHDLSAYSSRIEGIGVEKPYYSPYIAKKKEDEGWFPENVLPVVVYVPEEGGEPVAVPTTKDAIENLKAKVSDAEKKRNDTVSVSWLPNPISTNEAKRIIETFSNLFKDLEPGKPFDPDKRPPIPADVALGKKKQLVLRANIQSLEYEELQRREALRAIPAEPELPHSIRHGVTLLEHQRHGVAWMQHLYRLQSEHQVRGAVLADDMGLGKTFQLLALMAWLIEKDPNIAPMLVVAPVSLLENWAEEVNKFFVPNALPLLTAYGESLAALRVPRAQIDRRLLTEDGLVKFLRPDWLGDAKVVLTTYETLRDFEFSFAAQKWSLMVCDEAQRIKNPAAMVTRAAKKQNVAFKIACTGTPVENTLADLWCLFDYVQPGLLGALNDFGSRYRKPIEAKTDEEKTRVEELRSKIELQILRRLKSDVAADLPRKIIVDECRKLPLSAVQRNLYAQSIDSFKKRNDSGSFSPFKNHLGLLHYLRLVCTDPRPHGLTVFKPEPPNLYCEKAPKLNWLLDKLREVKAKGEKVIVFCEFREIQRLLQYYIEGEFGIRPDIINGETSAASTHIASRQKRIKAFQKLDGFGVLILSPVAVGFGVNIQAANHVVHYTRTWNPAKEDQATDRAYRIGQKKPVYVYYPVVHADDFVTFDAKLDQLLAYKRGLAKDMLNGSGDVAPCDFNIVDVVPEADAKEINVRVTLDVALRMTWEHFECLAAILWGKQGFSCYRTPGTNDNGVDVVALAGSRGILVQAKTSGKDGEKLSWDAVKEVVAGEAFYRKLHPGVDFDKVCITNQFFNQQAHENASLNKVKLLEQPHLSTLLAEHEVTMLEVEQMLYAKW
jgi:superfamily II DNA or RNA helicase/Holliday junction resolvase